MDNNSRQQLKKQVKKHIPKDWLCDLRIAYRIVMEAINDIKRTGIINLVIISNAQVSVVKDRVKEIKHVTNVKLIPKEESWKGLKDELGLQNIANPLPDTLRVRVDKPQNITEVFNEIKPISGVEDMGYAKELAKKIQFLTHVVNTTSHTVKKRRNRNYAADGGFQLVY